MVGSLRRVSVCDVALDDGGQQSEPVPHVYDPHEGVWVQHDGWLSVAEVKAVLLAQVGPFLVVVQGHLEER